MSSPGGGFTERLQLVVDATTSAAEAKWTRLTGVVRESGETATRSAVSVREAADRVAAAREREAQAAASLRVATQRLVELQESGRARASQLAAAEEKVAAAQRSVALSAKGTERALEDQTQAHRHATAETEEAGRSSGRLRDKLGEVRGSILAIGGAGLVAMIRGIGEGFAESARDAGQLATSMNATAEEAGALLGLVGTLGLDLNDLLEIQAEFATKTKDGMTQVGTQLQKNADGTVNWTTTLIDTLAALQKIPDATERNRAGFAMFGEEGYKQLSRLVSSGTSVEDAMARIGMPITQEDVDAAAEYDSAMMDLSLTGTRTSQALGRLLLPVLTGIAEGLGDLVDVAEDIPGPLALATAAAITLGLTGWNPAAAAGGRLALVMAAVNRQLALYNVASAISGRASATLSAGMAGAATAGRGLVGLVGGPLGVGLIAAGALWTAVSGGIDDFRESARKAAVDLSETDHAIRASDGAVQDYARRLADEADVWEGLAASRRGATEALDEEGGVVGAVDDATGGLLSTMFGLADQFSGGELAAQGYAGQIQDAAEELGAFGAQQETAQQATRSLNDMIAAGTTSGEEFAGAVQDAAEAEAAQSRTTDLAKAALEAYNATTRDAVQTQLDLFQATLQQRDGLIGVQQAVWDARDVVDDASTPWSELDESVNKVIGSVLDYGENAADAAVAAAKAQGQVVDELAESRIRADATLAALRESLNAPGLTDKAREQINHMITRLEDAKGAGNVEAILTLTGVDEAEQGLDAATQDRETTVSVESRGGPAVDRYLDGLATARRLALIRVESRNGPAVDTYLDRLAGQSRLALVRVESRGGPAVDRYLDSLAEQRRVAYIDVEERGSGAAGGGGTGSPWLRGAPGAAAAIATGAYGAGGGIVVQHLAVTVQADAGGRLTPQSLAEAGRQAVRAIAAHERRNGTSWRR